MTTEYAPGIAIKSCYRWVCFYKYVDAHHKPQDCPVEYMDDLVTHQLYPIDRFGTFHDVKRNQEILFTDLYQEWKTQGRDYHEELTCSLTTGWMEYQVNERS